jgi:hypothetical protein
MISLDEWKRGLSAWQNVRKQAEIDLEQTEIIIPLFEGKIKQLEEEDNNGKRSTTSDDTNPL